MNALRTFALCAVACIPLAGCVSDGMAQEASQIDITRAVGDRFVGRNAQEMMATFGAPLRSMPVGGEIIYTWERSDTLYFQYAPPAPVKCQLDAYVKPDGIVRTVGVNGQYGGCKLFLR